MHKLLPRDEFRSRVFARDKGTCVLCGGAGKDAHHILDRALFSLDNEKGGYFLDNGATVCSECHIKCEETDISVEQVRTAAGIVNVVVPSHLETGQVYDKWGNPVLPNGQRLRGEMFFQENVQKALRHHLHAFTHWVKYPRTFHLVDSPGRGSDDKVLPSHDCFKDRRIVITVKMDGENTTLYNDHLHARSLDSKHHPSRDWVKQFWSTIRHEIPEYWRVCGENLFAQHSVMYDDLPSYFLGFSIWNERNVALSWDETVEWFKLLGITAVPVIYDGVFDEKAVRSIIEGLDLERQEGIVVRIADAIPYQDFGRSVGKWVRSNHVQTDQHWMHSEVRRNGLRSS